MKIGMLYIGIGRYAAFWPEFYRSAREYFLPDATKHFFVFADAPLEDAGDDVSVFHNDDMGWPLNSLWRYHMFLRIADRLKEYDYLFFFNANCMFVRRVEPSDILPQGDVEYCAMCTQTDPAKMSLESRPECASYVAPGSVSRYWAGGINGGRAEAFLRLARECAAIAERDLANGFMPVWHDESVVNHFFADKKVRALDRRMGCPSQWKSPADPFVILRRKDDVLGRSWLRTYKGRKHSSFWKKLFRKLRK